MTRDEFDLLIVGSGPVGAAYARLVAEQLPSSSILMVELGPQPTALFGQHVTDISDADRAAVQSMTQGPARGQAQPGAAAAVFSSPNSISARPGLHLLGAGGMPAASMATGIGGMGTYWGGAIPRPQDSERIPWLGDDEWDRAVRTAERLLRADVGSPALSTAGEAVSATLSDLFDAKLPAGRKVGALPFAGRLDEAGHPVTTSVGDLVAPIPDLLGDPEGFEVRADTLCRSLTLQGDRVCGAVLEHRATGRTAAISARAVVVAADAFRTPQLLHASGIILPALGRYLMDHLLCSTVLAARADLQRHLIDDDDAANRQPTLYVPFAEPGHPFQGIVHQGLASEELLRKFGLGHLARHDRTGWVELSWSARTEPRPQNRVSFHPDRRDWCGMPAMSVDFELSDEDRRSAEAALEVLTTAANNLGRPVPGFEPRLCPPGTSLHYTGTVRMGPVPGDSASVCDPHSRVHGQSNLFVGGNGVIPLATTCNPTLTSIALAAHAIPAVLAAIS